MSADKRRILVTGGGTFLGDSVTAALLAEGAEVTLLVRPGVEDKLGPLRHRVRWSTADVWDPASLRGRARGHSVVIHTVGSMVADPVQGLTHHRLNFVSARNVVSMCVSDGVGHMVLMSSVKVPWISGQYIRAKREAEDYLERVGLGGTIIRAPVAYVRGEDRAIFFELLSLLGSIPPLSWTYLGRIVPMPIDVLARGVARIALDTNRTKRVYYAGDLRRRNTKEELRRSAASPEATPEQEEHSVHPIELLDEDAPFGWTPPSDSDRR